MVFIGQSWGAMYATAFINTYGDYDGRIRGAILTDPGAFTDEQLAAFMKRLQGSLSFTSEQLDDAFWSAQFLSKEDHERADYHEALLAMRGAPAEHRDPAKPAPIWR